MCGNGVGVSAARAPGSFGYAQDDEKSMTEYVPIEQKLLKKNGGIGIQIQNDGREKRRWRIIRE